MPKQENKPTKNQDQCPQGQQKARNLTPSEIESLRQDAKQSSARIKDLIEVRQA